MRIFRSADHRRMPWKNGGGTTTEILASPSGAGLDEFDWRVSMARVEADGPFSLFPATDRTLAVLDGEGLHLAVEGREPFALGPRSAPRTFPADRPTHSRLLAGPVSDLNVMTRRDRFSHSLKRLRLRGELAIDTTGVALILCHTGHVTVSAGASASSLGPLDCAFLEQNRSLLLEGTECEAFLIEILGP